MLSLIKKLLRIKSPPKAPVASPQKPEKTTKTSQIISRKNHCISKTNISINALKVLNRLHQQGYEACLVGGSVRDLLLGIIPKDFDVATNATPAEVNHLFRNSMLIGHRFRIVHVKFNREVIEVTTFRAGEESVGPNSLSKHHARKKDKRGMIIQDNIFGDISQDAFRRDFTVNALYYNIADFSVIDFANGYADLNAKLIRLIGHPETRYKEDPIRMLRAIRFAAKLNFTIEEKTAEPIKRLGPLLKNVPSARLSEEIFKVYHNGAAQEVHRLLCQHGIFELIFPQTAQLFKKDASEQKLIQQALENTDQRFVDQKPVMPAFLLAAMLWHPLLDSVEKFKHEGHPPLESIERAMAYVVHTQNEAIPMPKKYWQVVREIWILQYHFPRRLGPRPFRLTQHPRFRAAYDFLLIRALAGEEAIELAEWWTTFIEVDTTEKQKMVAALENNPTTAVKKKRRKKKPKQTSND